jgi:hypothetical protein
MAFFRLIQGRHFGIEVPKVIAPDYDDPNALVDLMQNHEERQRWLRIEKPEHGCAVLVHRPMHVGTWIDVDGGGVLHCVRGIGVVFSNNSSWRLSGFGRREYFRHTP